MGGGPPCARRAPLSTSCTHSHEAAVGPGMGGKSREMLHPFLSGFRDRLPGASPSGLPGADPRPTPSVTRSHRDAGAGPAGRLPGTPLCRGGQP